MNKKTKLIMSTFAVLILAIAIIGTVAYFTKSFGSDTNIVTAASFNVDVVNSEGTTIGDGEFNLGDKLFPGMDQVEAYSFQIKKNNTDVPIEYSIILTSSGDLFPSNAHTPIALALQRNIDDEWVEVDYSTTFRPKNDTERYRILVDWPHSDNDIDFQGKTGNIKLEVIATQVDAELEEPEGPPHFTDEVVFKATPNGATRVTTNKEIDFYVNDDGLRVIEVDMGEDTGEFEDKIGKLTISEEIHNEIAYFRVITENEYYASPTQIWRSRVDKLDTSVQGKVLFPATLAPYLSIESSALYDWFTK